jgi:putative ABC transport system permease protein
LTYYDAHPAAPAGLLTFVRLAPAGSRPALQKAVELAAKPTVRQVLGYGAATRMSFVATPWDEVHWAPSDGSANPPGSKGVTFAIAAIACLIVLVAAINFVTLTTARAARRGVEVGIRKATGAGRWHLVTQFMGEALLQVVASGLIATALAEILVKPFDALIQRDLSIDFAHDPLLLVCVAGFTLLIGLLASIYPAVVLSSFAPAAVLKGGRLRASGSSLARTSLVTVQFAVLVLLILTTLSLYRQTQFALARGLGAQDGNLIAEAYGHCGAAFTDEVRKLPGVSGTVCSLSATMTGGLVAPVSVHGRSSTFDLGPVGFGFLEFHDVHPLAGRLFSRGHGEDGVLSDANTQRQPTVILNETAARRLGYPNPQAAIGHAVIWSRRFLPGALRVDGPSEIVGVVPDLPQTVRSAVHPTMYLVAPTWFDLISIKLTGRDLPGTIRAINAAWKRTGDGYPINLFFLSQARQRLYADLLVQSETVAVCAALAVLIACLGLFALSAFITEQRTKEIGVRKVMGADNGQVVRLLLWQFTLPVLLGTAIAIPVGWAAMGWWLHGFAYHVSLSAWTFAVAGASAVALAWLTVAYQSFTAASSKPANSLRYE